eukprot:3728498-Amphidinium_carterae.1
MVKQRSWPDIWKPSSGSCKPDSRSGSNQQVARQLFGSTAPGLTPRSSSVTVPSAPQVFSMTMGAVPPMQQIIECHNLVAPLISKLMSGGSLSVSWTLVATTCR